MATKQPEMKVVCVTLKGKGWEDFSGTLCGIEFEEGEATLAMDMDPHGRDMIALRNVCSTYVGTSYEVRGDYVEDGPADEDEEEDDVIEPPKEDGDVGAHGESDEDAPETSEEGDGEEGADEAEGSPETGEGEGDEDTGTAAAKT